MADALGWLQDVLSGRLQSLGQIAADTSRAGSAIGGYLADAPGRAIDYAGNRVAIPFLREQQRLYDTDWSREPLLSSRLPAVASMVAPYLAGGAPGGLSAGLRLRGFHGSPAADLKSVSASPAARQFDNATSQFGAFFSPTEAGAARYAGKGGSMYGADLNLKNAYEMPWREFNYYQSPHKTALGDSLPGEAWAGRAAELKQEAAQFRDLLASQGYDGLVVRNRSGQPVEAASFNDVMIEMLRRLGGE